MTSVSTNTNLGVVGGDGDELSHVVCRHCDENTAFCGRDVSDVEWWTPGDEEPLCVVCADLEEISPCCGADCTHPLCIEEDA